RSARRARRAPRAGLERRGGTRAGPPRDRAAQPGRGGHCAARLQGPGPRVPLFPRTVRRGADRAAAPHQGRPAGAGSVLEGAGTQQATHRRLARPGRAPHRHQLPPRPPGHHPEQLRRRDAAGRGGRGAGRPASPRPGGPRLVRLRARRQHDHRLPAARGAGRGPRGAAQELRRAPHRGDAVPRRGNGRPRPHGLQLHSARLPRSLARGREHRARQRAVGRPLLAAVPPGGRDPAASYGTSDDRPKGEVTVTERRGRVTLEASVYRAVRDVADQPVIAPVLNSFASQELGADYGDYYLATGARLAYHRRLGTRGEWSATLSRDAVASLAVATTPATGSFRPNPPLGGPSVDLVRVGVRRQSEGFAVRRDLALEAALEGGRLDGSGRTYARATAGGRALVPLWSTRLLARAQLGLASAALPPHRAFVL